MRNTDTNTVRTRIARTLIALLAGMVVLSTMGPIAPVAAHAGHGPVSIAQPADAGEVAPGGNVTVEVTMNATGLNGPAIDLTLPAGWSVESYTVTSGPQPAEYKASEEQWVWLSADQPIVMEYAVSVPADASDGQRSVEAEGSGIEPDTGDRVTDTVATAVTVASAAENQAPSADFDWTPASPDAGETVTFDASNSTDPDGSIASYEWDVDDDGTFETSGAQVGHAFASSGSYPVTLRVTDGDGATDSTTYQVDVGEASTTYAVGQAGQCVIEMVPVGDGTQTGPEYYDYTDFSSRGGTVQYQQTYLSQFYVHEGSDGTNLVVLHDEWGDGTGGGAVTFDVTGLPEAGEWTVEDDDYGNIGFNDSNQDDHFVHDGSHSEMNWMYGFNTTDGGVFRGLDEGGWTEITIDPAFANESYAAQEREPPWDQADEGPREWEARSAGDVTEPLNMSQPVSIRAGACGAVSPEAQLSAPANVTNGTTVTLDASNPDSPTTAIQYEWDVDGDDTVEATTDGPTLDHQYDEAGTVEPSVTVTDRFGETDAATTTITVGDETENSPPSVELTADPSSVNVGGDVDLSADATDPDDDDLTYSWAQLSGDASLELPNGSDGTVTPTAAGTYEVQVTVEDPDGAVAADTATFSATEGNQAPSADFEWTPTSPTTGESVTFDASNSTDPDGSIQSYEWDVDGDGTFEANGSTTTHAFASAGDHDVTLRVTDGSGANDSVTETVSVTSANAAPSVTLSADPTAPTVGEDVTLAADATDPDDANLTYSWTQLAGPATLSLPDGTGGNVTPSTAGTYEVQVTVEDSEGENASDSVTIEATEPNEPPAAAFTWSPAEPTTGETVTFDASNATDADGNVTTYAWDFDGDGSVDDATTSPTTTHTFDAPGEYSVGLEVTDDDGATANATEQVTVAAANEPPNAAFEWTPTNPGVGENVTLDASGSDDADGNVTAYAWDVDGDGTFESNGQQLTRTFDSAGDREVVLRVTDGDGATDETTRTIAVGSTNQPPSVELSAQPSTVTAGDEVDLDADATDPNGDELNVSWEQLSGPAELSLPDGTTGTVTPPEPGTYEVQVTVEDSEGASDSAAVTIDAGANQPPEAAFDYSPERPKKGERVTFDATASDDPDGSIEGYAWNVDADGEFEASGRTAKHTFDSPGTHEVTLRVTDDRGATAKTTRTIEVKEGDDGDDGDDRDENEPPRAKLDVIVPHTDEPLAEIDTPVTFDASNSTDPDGDDGRLEFEWSVVSAPPNASLPSFDGGSSNEVILGTPGNWTVRVTVTDADGDTDSATKTARSKLYPTLHVDHVRVEGGTIEAGETARVNATVHNSGTGVGSANVSLLVDGEVVGTKSVEAGTEERVPAVFERQFDEPGTYNLTVLNADEEEAPSDSVELVVEEASSDAGSGGGSGPSYSAPGSSGGSGDGDSETTSSPTTSDGTTTDAGSTATESTTSGSSAGATSPTDAGDGTETTDTRSTATTAADPVGTEAPGQPGFGVAVAVLALLAAALIARRRAVE